MWDRGRAPWFISTCVHEQTLHVQHNLIHSSKRLTHIWNSIQMIVYVRECD